MLQELLNIIRCINGGTVIPDIEDSLSYHDLETDQVLLYLDQYGKQYYFSEYPADNKTDKLLEIERYALNKPKNYPNHQKPMPRDCYLILLYKVKVLSEDEFKTIIKLEENEYLFKKYVLYYTQEEWDAFTVWLDAMNSIRIIGIELLLASLASDEILQKMNQPDISFFLRLLIKIPFLQLPIKPANMKDFNSILDIKISNSRVSQIDLTKTNQLVVKALQNSKEDSEKAAELLFKDIMEG